jgi:ubiquinone/menaquinone biosynthesis C-methylase UbiE
MSEDRGQKLSPYTHSCKLSTADIIRKFGTDLSYEDIMILLTRYSPEEQSEIIAGIYDKQESFWRSKEIVDFYSNIYPFSPIVPHHLRQVIECLEVCDKEVIVDLGCGAGVLIHDLLRSHDGLHIKAIGLDLCETALEKASNLNKMYIDIGEAEFSSCNLREKLPLPDCYADKVVSNFAITYSTRKDVESSFRDVYRILKPDGMFTCATVIKGRVLSPLRGDILRLLGLDLFRKWRIIRRGLKTQKQLHHLFPMYSVDELIEMMESSKFEVSSMKPALLGASVIFNARKK